MIQQLFVMKIFESESLPAFFRFFWKEFIRALKNIRPP